MERLWGPKVTDGSTRRMELGAIGGIKDEIRRDVEGAEGSVSEEEGGAG